MTTISRRQFIAASLAGVTAGAWPGPFLPWSDCAAATIPKGGARIRFGLVTYMWGADWDLTTLLANCEKAKTYGVELRTGHAHRVEPDLDAKQRREVKRRFDDSPITLVGLGSNEAFHTVDQAALRAAIERAKAYIKLSHDVGGSGVKVKPNDLPAEVPREKTIEQIGRALNELGAYAADYGQQLRLEVHGQCSPLPIIAEIMKVADHPSVAVCWNSNAQDLKGAGIEHNFRLVEKRLGKTVHARQVDGTQYPYPILVRLLKQIDYAGWLLIEASDKPTDRVAALTEQREALEKLIVS